MMVRPRTILSLCAAIAASTLATPSAALAQVNTEALGADPLRAGWAGRLELALSGARGNNEVIDLGGGGRLVWQSLHAARPDDAVPWVLHRLVATASGRFGKKLSSGEAFASQAFAFARWSAMWHRRVGTELSAQYQYDEFLRLTARAVGGAKLRYELVHEPSFLLWGGSGYLLEHNGIAPAPGSADPPDTLEHRFINYLCAWHALFDGRLIVQNTLYLQPRFDEWSDVRVLDELELTTVSTKHLSLGILFALSHDSAPPTDVRSTDLRAATRLRLDW
jgi:hypothetical protein